MKWIAFGARHCALVLGGIALSTLAPGLAAAQGTGPGGGLTINSVGVNYTDETIYIGGEKLDFGPGPLMVFLGVEDITNLCELISPEQIECDLGDNGGLPEDGDYLLAVAQGGGQSQSDEYDLSILRPSGSDLEPANTYTNKSTTTGTSNNKNVVAECDAGDTLLSGGFALGSPGIRSKLAQCVAVWQSAPEGGGDRWRSFASEVPGCLTDRETWSLTTWVVCVDNAD